MARLAPHIRGAGLHASAGLVAVGTSVAGALGYVLTVVGARWLGPDEFGAFSALLAIIVVGNVAALAVQATTARATTTGAPAGPAVRTGVVMTVVITAVLGACSPLVSMALQVPATAALATAVAIGALTATAGPLGIVQGRERFRLLAALVAIQAAFRVGGGLVGMALMPSSTGGLLGVAAGLIMGAAVAWSATRPNLSRPAGHALRATAASGVMLLGFVVMTNIDVMLARHVLPAHASGLYAAGSIFTKVVFWLPQFVPMVAFPALSDSARRRAALTLGTLAVAGCGFVLTVLTWAFAEPAVRLVAGSEYLDVSMWIGGFSGLGALFALAHLLIYAQLARGDRWTTGVLWTVLVAYVAVVETTADDLGGVLVPGLVAAGIVVGWGLIRALSRPG